MTIQELKEKNIIYFSNIFDGLNQYQNTTLEMNEREAYLFFQKQLELYSPVCSYTDFYYFTLTKESKKIVEQTLSSEEIYYLQTIKPSGNLQEQLIFSLDSILLGIIVKLNAKEILFSTIYFGENKEKNLPRMTLWGNYGQQYIYFCD